MQHREHREWYSFAAVPKNEGKKTTQMKRSFLLSILASLAVVLSLSAPLNIDVAGPLKIDADVASTSLAAPLKIDAAAPQHIDADETMLEALASSLNVPDVQVHNAGETELQIDAASSSRKVRYIRIKSRPGRNNYLSISS
jgi:hypothetical protein